MSVKLIPSSGRGRMNVVQALGPELHVLLHNYVVKLNMATLCYGSTPVLLSTPRFSPCFLLELNRFWSKYVAM